ncbi:MAG: LamG-like jellyroll fold domain-containing protein [Bacteroidota bacterium]|jgi:hypothetical protein|nr:LamG-like jellyroll fold domain-containing protein [Bacteroidota bacterium]
MKQWLSVLLIFVLVTTIRVPSATGQVPASEAGGTRTLFIPNKGMRAGDRNWMQIPDNPSIAIPVFTAETWVRANSGGLIVTRDEPSGTPSDWQLWYDFSRRRLAFITAIGPPDSYFFTADNSFTAGDWHHVALVVNGPAGTAKLYIDGVLAIAPTFAPRDFDCLTGLAWCGYYNNGSGAYLDGEIDEARYWNIERTLQQIVATKDIDLPSNDRQGLVGWWRFCDSFEDYSGAGNHGTPMGSPRLVLNTLPFGITCGGDPCDSVRVTITGTQRLCAGDSTILAASPGFQRYRWSTGDTTRRIIARVSGNYHVTAVNADGCVAEADIDVLVLPLPVVDAGPDIIACKDVVATIGRGTPMAGWTYRWSPMDGLSTPDEPVTQVRTDSSRGYVLIVTDDAGCTARDTVHITIHDGIPLSLPDSIGTCLGASVILPLVVNGGVPPYRFTWSPALELSATDVRTPVATPSVRRWYFVHVTDALGCEQRDSILVTPTAGVVAVLPDTIRVCRGSSVQLPLLVGHGTPPLRFRWTPAKGLDRTDIQRPTATIDSARWYEAVVTDANGCEDRDSVYVLFYPETEILITIDGPARFCEGDSVRLLATPGFASYRWHTPSRVIPDTGNTIIARESGSYRVVVIDQYGCERVSLPVTITTFLAFTIPITVNGTQPLCEGDSVQLVAEGPPREYVWTNDSGRVLATGRAMIVAGAGRYHVFARDSVGCIGSGTVEVAVAPRPVFSITGPLVVCIGSVHEYRTSLRSGWEYDWTVTGGIVRSAPQRASMRIEWPTAGRMFLRLRVVDQTTGCMDSVDLEVTVITGLSPVILASGPTVLCEGDSVLLRSREIFPLYRWTDSTGRVLGEERSITVKQSGIYYLHVSTADGCEGLDSMRVTILPVPAPRIVGRRVVCLGDTAEYTQALRGMIIDWEHSGGVTLARDSTRILLHWDRAGLFRLVLAATDPSDIPPCAGRDTMMVEVQSRPVVALTALPDTVICEGDSLVLRATPGHARYLWSTPEGVVDTTVNAITVRRGGIYAVRVVSAGGCDGESQPVTIIVHPAPDIQIVGPASVCRDAVVTYAVRDAVGAALQWTVTGGTLRTSATQDSITVHWPSSGRWLLTVTADNGFCLGVDSMVVDVGDSVTPVIAGGPFRFCPGGYALLRADNGYVSYEWQTPDGNVSGQQINAQRAGLYRVHVRTAEGCSGTSDPVLVEELPAPRPRITGPDAFCPGDSVTLTVTPGYVTYVWNDGWQGPARTLRTAVTVTVTVTDSNGCTGTSDPFTIHEHPRPEPPVISRSGMELVATPAAAYQWIRNDTVLAGETERSCRITLPGTYRVRTWNTFGCPSWSEVLPIVCAQGHSIVALPHVSAAPGDTVRIRPALTAQHCLDDIGASSFIAALRYHASLLVPIARTPDGVLDGDERVIPFNGTMALLREGGPELLFLATLGVRDSIPLTLEQFEWVDVPVTTERVDGSLRLIICREGGDRLFDAVGSLRLLQNRPNPFNTMTVIAYELIEHGYTELSVLNILGRRVRTLFAGTAEPGTHQLRFDAGSLPSGQYILVLSTPTAVRHRVMSLVK